MNFAVEILQEIDENLWNNNLSQNKASTAYQIANWTKTYEESFGSQPLYILVKNNNGKIVGQLTALIHTKFIWRNANVLSRFIGYGLNLGSLLTWFYGPIIHDQPHREEIISKILIAIDNVAAKNKINVIRGISPPLERPFDDTIFKNIGYTIRPWSTYVISLGLDTDKIYVSLDKKIRYEIRKAEESGVKFEVVNDRSLLDEYVKLRIQENYRIKEKARLRPNVLDNNWKFLNEKGYAKVFLASHKGQVIGGIWNIIFNGNIVQHGVVNSSKTKLGGSFLTWNTIKWTRENGYCTYDMGGANPYPKSEKEKGIDFYKSKWGGTRMDYTIYVKVFNKTKARLSSAIVSPRRAISKMSRITRPNSKSTNRF